MQSLVRRLFQGRSGQPLGYLKSDGTWGDVADLAAASHTHSASAITSGTLSPARLGSGDTDSSVFLRGDGTWGAPTTNISGLTELTAPAAQADSVVVYDASAAANRRVALWRLSPEANMGWLAVAHCHFWQITDALRDVNSVASNGTIGSTPPWDQSAAGVVRCTTSTNASGRAGFQSSGAALRMGGGAWRYEARIRTGDALSDGTTDYFIYAGFLDNWGGEPTDGVYWRYNDGNSSGQWELVQMSSNTPIVTASGVTVATSTTYKLTIDVAADGSSCSGTVNGTTVTPLSFGVPTSSGRDTGICPVNIRKTGGASDRFVDIDYFTVLFRPTSEV